MGTLNIDLVMTASPDYVAARERGHPYRSYAPTTLSQLAALIPPAYRGRVRAFDLAQDPVPSFEGTDIVAISSITCGAALAYRLADEARSQGKLVVIGGAHATALPEEAAQHADAVVVGYAERSWPELIRDAACGRLRPRYEDFSNPFAAGSFVPDRSVLKGKRYFFTRTLEASRGCPNTCGFCATSSLNGGKAYLRSVSAVRDDIGKKGGSVLFLDSNLTENHPPGGELFSYLCERGIRSYGAGSIKLADDPSQAALASKRGLGGLLVGFESVCGDSLDAVGKGFNRPERYARAVRVFHDNGIKILGCFVLGLDSDDEGVFERTLRFIEDSAIDIVRIAIATPLPGTRLYAELEAEGRILERDWGYYDMEHVVFRPRLMRSERLVEGFKELYRRVYSLPSIVKRLMAAPPSLLSLGGNLGFRQLALDAASREER
jgi:radical SAM superfamily enzyme YgiQ (UPF0313 family)